MENNKIILDLCGGTGSWSKPYAENGYEVLNVEIKEGLDIKTYSPPEKVYGILSAPPCTMFSFARTNAKKPRDLKEGMEVVQHCLRIIWECQTRIKKDTQKFSPLKFWALENPNGMLKYFLGKPAFEFNPYDFGDNYKKKTHIWGWFNNPIKSPIQCDKPKFDKLTTREIHLEYYGNLDRQSRRAITPKGFANAFFEANR